MKLLLCALIVFMSLDSCDQNAEKKKIEASLLKIRSIEYPSGSTLSFYKNKLYLMGDDARGILILDTAFNYLDTLPVSGSESDRVSKVIKPDIESSELIENSLILLGSGSISPYRDSLVKVDLNTNTTTKISLNMFYTRLRADVEQLNIEAFAKVKNLYVVGHRRNMSDTRNYLITTSSEFWPNQHGIDFKLIPFVSNRSNAGISGMAYSSKADILFITCSEERTQNSYYDGEIGKSYIGIISEASTKLSSDSLTSFNMIPLSTIDKSFNKMKIESVAVAEGERSHFILYFVADNDKGNSVLFKVKLTLN